MKICTQVIWKVLNRDLIWTDIERFFIQNLNLGKLVLQVKSRWIFLKICPRVKLQVLNTNLTTIFNSPVAWQKGESQNGGNKNTKHAKFSEKRTFFGKFGVLCILVTSILRFALGQIGPNIRASLNLHENWHTRQF